MTIVFTNRSRYAVLLRLNDGDPAVLQPFVPTPVVSKESAVVKAAVRRDGRSYIKKWSLSGPSYHLLLETEYQLSSVPDGEKVDVTREKIRFSPNAAYDRLFLRPGNAVCLSQAHRVVGEEKIKRAFVRDHWVECLLFKPLLLLFFESFPYTIPLVIGGIVAAIFWRWQYVAAIFLALYLLVLGGNALADAIFSKLDRESSWKHEKEEFYQLFQPAFLQEYYAMSDREPFSGTVETD